jgi:large subunit ribosomal protein L35
MRTNKATAKRIRVTKSGKFKRLRAYRSHNKDKKTPGRKRQYSREQDVSKGDRRRIKRVLGI